MRKKKGKLGSYRGFWWCKRATVKFRRKENIYLAAFNVELCWQDTLGTIVEAGTINCAEVIIWNALVCWA